MSCYIKKLEDMRAIFDMMFREGEFACFGKTRFDTNVIGVAEVLKSRDPFEYQFVAINPLRERRAGRNVTAHRTFLVEPDGKVPLEEQPAYIESMKMPYSARVFSGNKSLHHLIVLDQDVSAEEYGTLARWLFKIMDKADPVTKNPAWFTRMPWGRRDNGAIQEVREVRALVPKQEFVEFLHAYPDLEPKPLRVFDRASLDPSTVEYRRGRIWKKTRQLVLCGECWMDSRHSTLIQAASNFQSNLYTQEETLGELFKVLDHSNFADFPEKELVGIVEWVFAQDPIFEPNL